MWQCANPNPHLNLTLTNPNNGRSGGTSVRGHMGLTPFWTVIGSPMKSLTNTWAKSQHCDLPPGRTRKIMTEVNLNEFFHFFRWGLLLNKASVCRLWPWKWETNWKRSGFMIANLRIVSTWQMFNCQTVFSDICLDCPTCRGLCSNCMPWLSLNNNA